MTDPSVPIFNGERTRKYHYRASHSIHKTSWPTYDLEQLGVEAVSRCSNRRALCTTPWTQSIGRLDVLVLDDKEIGNSTMRIFSSIPMQHVFFPRMPGLSSSVKGCGQVVS